MKKFILLFTGIYFTVMSTATAVVTPFVVGGMALAQVAEGLQPIFQPIAQQLIEKVAAEIQGLVQGNKCVIPIGCKGSGLLCKFKSQFPLCKGACQVIKQVGGYELRIRFGKGWDLTGCVRQGVMKGFQPKKGRGFPTLEGTKSIAVYSQEDLDKLLSLIALQMAARHIADSEGRELKDEKLRAAKKNAEEVVKDARELVKKIDNSIKENVENYVYGNQ